MNGSHFNDLIKKYFADLLFCYLAAVLVGGGFEGVNDEHAN